MGGNLFLLFGHFMKWALKNGPYSTIYVVILKREKLVFLFKIIVFGAGKFMFLMTCDTEGKICHMAKLYYLSVEISALGVIQNKLPAILNFIFPPVLKPVGTPQHTAPPTPPQIS